MSIVSARLIPWEAFQRTLRALYCENVIGLFFLIPVMAPDPSLSPHISPGALENIWVTAFRSREHTSGEFSAPFLSKWRQENDKIESAPWGGLGRSGRGNSRTAPTSDNGDKRDQQTSQTTTRMTEASKPSPPASYPQTARSTGCNRQEYALDRPGGSFLVLTLGFLRQLVGLALASADGSGGHHSSNVSHEGQGLEHVNSRGELGCRNATNLHDCEHEREGRRSGRSHTWGGGGKERAAVAEPTVWSELADALRDIHVLSVEGGGVHDRLIDAMSPTLFRNLVPLVVEAFEPPPDVILRTWSHIGTGWTSRRVDGDGGDKLFAHDFATSGNSEIASFLGSAVHNLVRLGGINVATATNAADEDDRRKHGVNCGDRCGSMCSLCRHRSRAGFSAARINDEATFRLPSSQQDLDKHSDNSNSGEDTAAEADIDRTKNPVRSSQDPWDVDSAVTTASYSEHELDATVATGADRRDWNLPEGGLSSPEESMFGVSPCIAGRSFGSYSSTDSTPSSAADEIDAKSCVMGGFSSTNAIDVCCRGCGGDEEGMQDGNLLSSVVDDGGAEGGQGNAVATPRYDRNLFPKYVSGGGTTEDGSYGASTFAAEDSSLASTLAGGFGRGVRGCGADDSIGGGSDRSNSDSYGDDSWATAEDDSSSREEQQAATKTLQQGVAKPDCCHTLLEGGPFLDSDKLASYPAGGKHLTVLAEMQRANVHIEFPGLAQDARTFADLLVRLAEGGPVRG